MLIVCFADKSSRHHKTQWKVKKFSPPHIWSKIVMFVVWMCIIFPFLIALTWRLARLIIFIFFVMFNFLPLFSFVFYRRVMMKCVAFYDIHNVTCDGNDSDISSLFPISLKSDSWILFKYSFFFCFGFWLETNLALNLNRDGFDDFFFHEEQKSLSYAFLLRILPVLCGIRSKFEEIIVFWLKSIFKVVNFMNFTINNQTILKLCEINWNEEQ